MRFTDAFTPAQASVLAELHERDGRERAAGIREPKSLKAIGPSVAELLYLLILQKGANTVVEFGTSHGYSTIHLAAATDRTNGRVYSVDEMPEKTDWARQNLESAGLSHRVTLATSDGVDFAATLPFDVDFVLVDYGITAFLPAFTVLRDRLLPGCLIFVDGGPDDYWESGAGAPFRQLLAEDPHFLVSILPMHRKQLIAVRTV